MSFVISQLLARAAKNRGLEGIDLVRSVFSFLLERLFYPIYRDTREIREIRGFRRSYST